MATSMVMMMMELVVAYSVKGQPPGGISSTKKSAKKGGATSKPPTQPKGASGEPSNAPPSETVSMIDAHHKKHPYVNEEHYTKIISPKEGNIPKTPKPQRDGTTKVWSLHFIYEKVMCFI